MIPDNFPPPPPFFKGVVVLCFYLLHAVARESDQLQNLG